MGHHGTTPVLAMFHFAHFRKVNVSEARRNAHTRYADTQGGLLLWYLPSLKPAPCLLHRGLGLHGTNDFCLRG